MAATGSDALSTQSGDVEHQNGHQLLLIILSVVFSVITASCIGFRLYTRIYVVGKTFLEDGMSSNSCTRSKSMILTS